MAQLFAQQDRQPDVWVMSGAPTATTVFLSLDTTINYSSGSPDTLPANTPAVIYGTSDTAFDRSLDVWVPFTVRASRVLSIIKESLLATITADYVAMARVELHGIKPYQPEPYLASGGLGTAPATATTLVSTAGQGTVFILGSEPAGWHDVGFDDSAWSAALLQSGLHPHPNLAGSDWITATLAFTTPDDLAWLHRRIFVLPPGPLTSATLQIWADDQVTGVWINGTFVFTGPLIPPGGTYVVYTVSVPPASLTPGASNLLAVKVTNNGALTALDYLLSVTGVGSGGLPDPGGSEGDLLSYHSGAWSRLPVGTSGARLASDGTDPYWATGGTGGLYSAYLCYQDQQAQNTNGGTFTSGAWRTRVLSTEVADTGSFGSVASNQITLAAGTYRVLASAPAFACGRHQLRLQNITDGSTLVTGLAAFAANPGGGGNSATRATLAGRFTLAASKTIELQHQCEATSATIGLGVACNFTTEVFACIELFKE